MKKKFSSFLHSWWPLLGIVAAVLVFFYPVWLRGFVPLPADFIAGVYYPWLDYKWGFPTGVPVKNPITTDVVSFIYPMQTYAVELLKRGIIPLWNPLIFTGTPLLANFQSAPFSPTNIVYFILPTIWAWTAQIMLQPLLGAIWTYLLLRYFKVSKFAASIGAIVFAFSGFMMIWMQWNGHSLAAGFIPLSILLLARFLDTGKTFYGVLISAVLAAQLFSGYPQVIIYSFLALGLYYLIFRWRKLFRIKTVTSLVLFVFLGFGLAAVQIIPGYELLNLSQRDVEQLPNAWAFLPWSKIITFIAPDYFGNHATGNYWGPQDYTTTTGYTGVIAAILASLAVLLLLKKKAIQYFLALALVGIIVVFPTPVSVWFKESGFFGLQAASAHRALILVNLGLSTLAAFGIDLLLSRKIGVRDIVRSLYAPGILLFVFGLVTLASWLTANSTLEQGPTEKLVKFVLNMKVGLRNLVLPTGLFILSGIALLIIQRRWLSTRLVVSILSLLLIFEIFRFGWKFTPFSPTHLVYPTTPVLDFLQKREQPSRVYAESVVPINLMMTYKVETPEGYDAVYPLSWARYLGTINSGNPKARPMGRYGSIDRPDSRLLDLANTKYVLTVKRNREGNSNLEGQLNKQFALPYFKEVFEDKTVVVLENEHALPRAFMVYDWEVIDNSEKQLARLLDRDFPLDSKVILEEGISLSRAEAANFSISDISYEPNKVSLRVRTQKEGILFMSDSWYPGWKAFVDEAETKLLRANYTYRAIVVPEDEHNIQFIYSPTSFKIGRWISLATVAVLVALIFARQNYESNTKTRSPVTQKGSS